MLEFEKIKQFYRLSKDLSLKEIQYFFQNAQKKTYPKGSTLVQIDDTQKVVYFIIKGLIRVFTLKENGDDVTFGLLSEYSIYTNVDIVIFNQPSRYSVQAVEHTEVFCIEYDALMELLDNHPKLQRHRERIFQATLRRLLVRLETLVLLTPEERYIEFIKNNYDLSNRVPDKYIANYLGITPVSLSRIRRRIAEKKRSQNNPSS